MRNILEPSIHGIKRGGINLLALGSPMDVKGPAPLQAG